MKFYKYIQIAILYLSIYSKLTIFSGCVKSDLNVYVTTMWFLFAYFIVNRVDCNNNDVYPYEPQRGQRNVIFLGIIKMSDARFGFNCGFIEFKQLRVNDAAVTDWNFILINFNLHKYGGWQLSFKVFRILSFE